MEDDPWSHSFSASSRSYQSARKSLSDLCIDFEDIEGDDDDASAEYPCPFCTEDFDLVDLCYHINDEHHLDAGSGVCPVCGTTVGMNMVGHITAEHGYILKSLQKLKLRKGESPSSLSFLKKELEDGYLRSLLAGSSAVVSSSKMESDPLLSFLYNVPPADKPGSVQSGCSSEVTLEEKSLDEKILERNVHPSLSDEEQMEKANRSEFVQGLLLSTIFDDSV